MYLHGLKVKTVLYPEGAKTIEIQSQ